MGILDRFADRIVDVIDGSDGVIRNGVGRLKPMICPPEPIIYQGGMTGRLINNDYAQIPDEVYTDPNNPFNTVDLINSLIPALQSPAELPLYQKWVWRAFGPVTFGPNSPNVDFVTPLGTDGKQYYSHCAIFFNQVPSISLTQSTSYTIFDYDDTGRQRSLNYSNSPLLPGSPTGSQAGWIAATWNPTFPQPVPSQSALGIYFATPVPPKVTIQFNAGIIQSGVFVDLMVRYW